MLTRIGKLALAATTLAVASGTASAQTSLFSGSGCGGNTFVSCVGYNASYSGSTLFLTVTNLSNNTTANNPGSVFTEVGLGNIGTTYTLASGGFSFTGAGAWSYTSDLNGYNGQGLVADTFGADANSPAPQNGLQAGQTVTFQFVFTQPIDASAFDQAQIALHDQGGFDACGASSKLVLDASSGQPTAGSSSTCTPPTNTVPEPSSVALLGTGLVGLVPMIRRKRK